MSVRTQVGCKGASERKGMESPRLEVLISLTDWQTLLNKSLRTLSQNLGEVAHSPSHPIYYIRSPLPPDYISLKCP